MQKTYINGNRRTGYRHRSYADRMAYRDTKTKCLPAFILDRVSLCRPNWLQTHIDPPVSASRILTENPNHLTQPSGSSKTSYSYSMFRKTKGKGGDILSDKPLKKWKIIDLRDVVKIKNLLDVPKNSFGTWIGVGVHVNQKTGQRKFQSESERHNDEKMEGEHSPTGERSRVYTVDNPEVYKDTTESEATLLRRPQWDIF